METRKANVIFSKAGGNASKASYNTKISLPKVWVDEMGFSVDERNAVLEYDGDKITIRKGEANER